MKQHVSSGQARELSVDDQSILKHWWLPASGDCWVEHGSKDLRYVGARPGKELSAKALPLLSVGQMIDFLGDIQLHDDGVSWVVVSDLRVYMPPEGAELCDSLWEAMKGEISRPKQLKVQLASQLP
jgi:hypothetical protein